MKIPVFKNALINGGIVCENENCVYSRRCTNHHTAGDYRSDYGLQPDITITKDPATSKITVDCATADKPPRKGVLDLENLPQGNCFEGPAVQVRDVHLRGFDLGEKSCETCLHRFSTSVGGRARVCVSCTRFDRPPTDLWAPKWIEVKEEDLEG